MATDLSTLLEHAGWVRGLATRVARGDEDDAVQELWLSALKSGPDSTRPPRPWLARVLANAARRRFRDTETRRRNEAEAAGADEVTTPEAAVARAEVHRLLVEAVLGLEEPFRQTVVLRFFDGLTSGEIARRLDVPDGTVRWRLKEALERLRVTLDERHGGRRETWLLAVTPLLLPNPDRWFTAGVTLMNKKLQAGLVTSALVVVGLLVGWRTVPREELPLRPVEAQAVVTQTPPSPQMPAESTRPSRPAEPVPVAPAFAGPAPSAAVPFVPMARDGGALGPIPGPPVTVLGASPVTDAGSRFSLDARGIREAMRSAMPQVKDCYEAWLGLEPTARGTLTVSLVIETDDGVEGRISRLGRTDGGVGLGNTALEGCVLASFADLRFEPPLDGPLSVTYPLRFELDGGSR